MKNVVCPYCGHEHEDWQNFVDFEELEQDFELACDECGKCFNVHADFNPRFRTEKLQ